jgi:predicted RNA binding protein with dsRBD fold (UPF0201 family)
MGAFSKKLNEIAGSSRFSRLELEKMFKTEDEQKQLARLTKVLREETRKNAARKRLLELGDKGLDALIKVGKKALV